MAFLITQLSLTYIVYGLIVATGSGIGGFVGVKLSIIKFKSGETIIKIAFAAISIVAIIRLFV